MSYVKTTWVNNTTPASQDNMNHIEQGIADAHTALANTPQLSQPNTFSQPVQVQGSGALLALWYNIRDGVNDNTPQPTDLIQATLESSINFTNKLVGGVTAYYVVIKGYIKMQYAETYTIYATSDDAVRVIVDGTSLFGEAGQGVHGNITYSGTVTAKQANQWLPITIEHINYAANERLLLEWSSASQTRQTIPGASMKWSMLPFDNAVSTKNVYAYSDVQVKGNSVWHRGNMHVQSTAPSSPQTNDIWIDTSVSL